MKLHDIVPGYLSLQYSMLHQQSALYEGLVTSADPKTTSHKLHSIAIGGKITANEHKSVLDVTWYLPVDMHVVQSTINTAKVLGWFLAVANVFDRKNSITSAKTANDITSEFLSNGKTLQLVFEAKFGYRVLVDKQSYFHATPTTKVDKILRIGLTPRSHSKLAQHPDRIYVTTSIGELNDMLIPHFKKLTNEKDWTILDINPQAFEQPGVRLFSDPAFPGGFYTLSNISPLFISVHK